MAAPSESLLNRRTDLVASRRGPAPRALLALLAALVGCGPEPGDGLSRFLKDYGEEVRRLRQAAGEADWALNTPIVPGDTSAAARSERAHRVLGRFVGSRETVGRLRSELERPDLGDLERRQLQAMLRAAASYPEAAEGAAAARVRLENAQIATLYGFDFRLEGRSVTPNEIDAILRSSHDLALRRAAWTAAKEVGRELRPNLLPLRDLRNETVRALGWTDFAELKTSAYGMPRDELLALMDELVADAWPLYRELHTWARHELAARYGEAVPELLPAHWLPDRWGQDWGAIPGGDRSELDRALAARGAEWIVREAE
ncbi:MAG: M2 family metallopeptidase, partial [Gemmatimonadota bacterium]|nr:M2 family metallopeptidase [Gemmatimonadota bacterium]